MHAHSQTAVAAAAAGEVIHAKQQLNAFSS